MVMVVVVVTLPGRLQLIVLAFALIRIPSCTTLRSGGFGRCTARAVEVPMVLGPPTYLPGRLDTQHHTSLRRMACPLLGQVLVKGA